MTAGTDNLAHFIYEKWGDLIALLILFVGIGLVLLCQDGRAPALGESLVMAALVGLKMTKTQPPNGNGNGEKKP